MIRLFIGSGNADLFVYTGGKDAIQDFGDGDQISLDGDFDFNEAKITASNRSFKFKFSSKNTLAIKAEKGGSLSGTFTINGETQTFEKNAIGDGEGNVSLTSAFSGTYKIDTDDEDEVKVQNVYGGDVKKNLTYKGTEEAETLTGGQKKTKFKGGGGADTLVGGEGKDTFFYAKGETGDVTIASFDFSKDKLKIASNTIANISTVEGGIKFDMGDGSFNLEIDNTSETLIRANNTAYWFAQSDGEDINGNSYSVGALITADKKISKSEAASTGYGIIDLGYSTNLAKTGVAFKVANAKPKQS